MIRTVLFIAGTLVFVSCKPKKNEASKSDTFAKMEMLDVDRKFSKMSGEKGMKAAFIEYIDSNGVLLRPNMLPIVGADAIDYLLEQNDSDYTLTWEPRDGYIARSGDLGYTYGIYALRPSQKDTIIYGTYVSIWKREKDGSWKFVLDSGNEGIGGQEMLNQ
jgi:ketosteroid isomerase-like protein